MPENFDFFKIVDKRVNLNERRSYGIFVGAGSNTSTAFNASTYTSTQVVVPIQVPSTRTIVDRAMYTIMPIQLDFVGDVANVANVINVGYADSIRAFGFNAIVQSTNLQINGASFNLNDSQIVRHIMRYYNWEQQFTTNLSGYPNALDQSQLYSQLLGSIRNPMGSYIDADQWNNNNGAFNMRIISNSPSAATVQFDLYVPLFLSPMIWNRDDEAAGLTNIQNIQIQYNLKSPNQIWSHSEDVTTSTISSLSLSFYQLPVTYVTFISPKDNMSIPQSPTFSYYDFQDYATNIGAIAFNNMGNSIASNTIQLSSIPSIFYVMIRQQDTDLTYTSTDTYALITNISVNFDNTAGIMSSLDAFGLYNVALNNGVNLSWPQWSCGYNKGTGNIPTDAAANIGVGSILAIVPGRDFVLADDQAVGKSGKYTLQVTASFLAVNPSATPINYQMHIIVGSEGYTTFPGPGEAPIQKLGVLSDADIASVQNMQGIDSQVIRSVYGGNFFGAVKKFYEKAKPFIRPVAKIAADIGELTPFAPAVKVARNLVGVGRKKKPHKIGGRLVSVNDLDDNIDNEYLNE